MGMKWFGQVQQQTTSVIRCLAIAAVVALLVPTALDAQIVNDLCVDALQLSCADGPFSYLGNNTGASATNGAPFCGTSPGTQAVWYKVVGNGGQIQVDTCSPNTVFDTKINVFTGDCADQPNFTCVGGNDDAAGAPLECDLGGDNRLSRVIFDSVDGVEYLIVVSGFAGASGNFEVLLDCEVPVELQHFTIE